VLTALTVASLLLVGSAASFAQTEGLAASGVQLDEHEGEVYIDLAINGKPEFTTERRNDPMRVVVTLPGVTPTEALLESPSALGSPEGPVAKVLVLDAHEKLGEPGTLLAVYLRTRARVRIGYTDEGTLRVGVDHAAAPDQAPTPIEERGPAPSPKPEPASPEPADVPGPEAPATVENGLVVISGAGTSIDEDGRTHIGLRASGPVEYRADSPSGTVLEITLSGVEMAEAIDLSLPEGKTGNVRAVSMVPVPGDTPGAKLTVVCRTASECEVVPAAEGHGLEIIVPAFDPDMGPTPLELAGPRSDDVLEMASGAAQSPPLGPEPAVSPEDDSGQATTVVAGQDRPSTGLSAPGVAGVTWEPIGGTGTVVEQGGGYQAIPGPRRPDSGGGSQPSTAPALPTGAAPGMGTMPVYLREGTISLDIPSSPVQTALTAIAYYADVDIVIDDSVTGDISVTMSDVTAEEAIDIICSIKDLVWYKRGTTYVITSRAQDGGGPIPGGDGAVQSYSPQFTDQESLTQYTQLLNTLHPRVLVQVYQQAGVIVIAGDAEDVQAAMDTLIQADTLTSPDGPVSEGQVTQPYTMNSGDPQQLTNFLIEVYPSGLTVHPRPNSQQIVLKGPRAVVNSALELLAELERQGGRIVSDTYKPSRLGVSVVSAAVNEVFPAVATRVEDQTLIVTGTSTDVQAAITHAKAVDHSLVTDAEAVEEYVVQSRHVDGLTKVAEQAYAGTAVKIRRIPDTKTIIVMGPEEDVAEAMAKLAEWDKADESQAVTRTVAIKHEDAGYVAEMIDGLNLHPSLDLSTSGDMLQVTGPSIVVAEAMDIIAQTDLPDAISVGGQDIVTERRVLSYVDTATAKQALDDIFKHQMMTTLASVGQPGATAGAAAPPAPQGVFNQFGGADGVFADGPATVPDVTPPPDTAVPTGANGQPTNLPAGPGAGATPVPGVPGQPTGTTPTPAGATAGGLLVITEEAGTHCLVITGPEWAVDRAMALLEQIDVPPHQVVIEAIIADVNRSYLKDKGLEWNFGSTSITENGVTDPEGEGFDNIAFGSFSRRNLQFNANIFLSEDRSKSKLLANPSLRAVDGSDSKIQIGDELRFQVLQPTSAGSQPVFNVETVDVGIILEFMPTITEDGRVRLDLRAESSSVSGFTNGFPNIRKREAETDLILQDGETIVIGGLVSENEIETLREVPLLSEIPVLGELFRHRTVDRTPQELVFFITPRILYAVDGELQTDQEQLDLSEETAEQQMSGWINGLPSNAENYFIDANGGNPTVVEGLGGEAVVAGPAPQPQSQPSEPTSSDVTPEDIPTTGALARRHGR
jgi:type II secretory pathway component GspD/PulD (secretin)